MKSNHRCVFLYEANHINNILYVDNDSMKRAGQIDSPEFAELLKVKNALPGYKLKVKVFPKTNKRTYSGLTFQVMQAFIIQCEGGSVKAEESLRELNKARAQGLLHGSAYGCAKSWFLEKYGKAYNKSELPKNEGKREALIAELLANVDNSIMNPMTALTMEGGVCGD